MSQRNAQITCKNLGNGHLKGIGDKVEFDNYLSWLPTVTTMTDCKDMWTPLRYNTEKNILLSLGDNSTASFVVGLGDAQPTVDFGVQIQREERSMVYNHNTEKKCFTCVLNNLFYLLLRGQKCESSYLGKYDNLDINLLKPNFLRFPVQDYKC